MWTLGSFLNNVSLGKDDKGVKVAVVSTVVESDVVTVELQVWFQCSWNYGVGSEMCRRKCMKKTEFEVNCTYEQSIW